jgi:hypothetical protein
VRELTNIYPPASSMRPPKRNLSKSRVSKITLLAFAASACGVGEAFTVGQGPVRNGARSAVSGGRIPSWVRARFAAHIVM